MRKKKWSTLDAEENVSPINGTFSDFVFAKEDSTAVPEPDFESRKSSGLRWKKERLTVCKDDDLRLNDGTCSIVDMYVKESTRVLKPGSKLGTKLCADASDAVPKHGVESVEELGVPMEVSSENDTFKDTRKKKRVRVDIQKPAEHHVLEEKVLSKEMAGAVKDRFGLENSRNRKKIVVLPLAAEPAARRRSRFEGSTKEVTQAAEAAADPFKKRVGLETLRKRKRKKFGLEVVSEIKLEPVMDQRLRADGVADLPKERPGSKKLKKRKTIPSEARWNFKSGSGVEQGLRLGRSREEVAEAAGDPIRERAGLVKSEKSKNTVSKLKVEFLGRRGWREDSAREDLKYGKYTRKGKFTRKEDENIKSSVYDYIRMQGLERIEGLQMVLHCRKHKELRGCWLDIAKTLPHRSKSQIYARAHRLLGDYRGCKRGRWSVKEKKALSNLYITYGNNWKEIATHMDRSRKQCLSQWRRLRCAPTMKAGPFRDKLKLLAKRYGPDLEGLMKRRNS